MPAIGGEKSLNKSARNRTARRLLTNGSCLQMSDTHERGRVLAIEPDRQDGAVLRRALVRQVRAQVTVVRSVDQALASIAEQVPDLILIPTFLAPAELTRLMNDLRARPDARHTQVVTTPKFPERPVSAAIEHRSGRVVPFPSGPAVAGEFRDPGMPPTEVQHYLAHARALRAAAAQRPEQGLVPIASLADGGALALSRLVRAPSAGVNPPVRNVRDPSSTLRPSDRRRASRHRAADLGGRWAIRLKADEDARIVDISRTGVRLETTAVINPGSLINLEVIGMEDTHLVDARLIRSEVIETADHPVKYRSAAMFLREIDLFAAQTSSVELTAKAASCHTPGALADLLGRVLASANWVANGAGLRSRFETEVRALVGAKEVRICAAPARASGGCQSLYFSIPGAAPCDHGLLVVFDRGYRPTAADFRVLKAAASLASVVLDLSPAADRSSRSPGEI
jgi:hypothetical protein